MTVSYFEWAKMERGHRQREGVMLSSALGTLFGKTPPTDLVYYFNGQEIDLIRSGPESKIRAVYQQMSDLWN